MEFCYFCWPTDTTAPFLPWLARASQRAYSSLKTRAIQLFTLPLDVDNDPSPMNFKRMRLVGLVGVGCFLILLPFLSKILIVILDYIDLQNPTDNRAFLNIATTLAFSPIAFLIWTFCDQNHLRQLDHQRKDINLKEFQKLSEWASGQHLPETKISRKTSKDTSKDTHEIHQAPTDKTELISRWDGAIALQISAIEQLEIYLHGEQGRAFQRPAFLLLKQL